ncbi:MAG: sn-glycerol 3-phosphate transport system substrate-binding protein, partial [Moritella dasanensis]
VTKAAYALTKKSGYYQEHPDAEVGVKQLSLPGGEWTNGYRLGFYSQIQEIMHREFDNVFANRTSVEKALSNIDKESQVILSRFARTVR